MAKQLTSDEKRIMKEMIEIHGGKDLVDVAKIKRRILAKRLRKTNRTTARDMEDIFGY